MRDVGGVAYASIISTSREGVYFEGDVESQALKEGPDGEVGLGNPNAYAVLKSTTGVFADIAWDENDF